MIGSIESSDQCEQVESFFVTRESSRIIIIEESIRSCHFAEI